MADTNIYTPRIFATHSPAECDLGNCKSGQILHPKKAGSGDNTAYFDHLFQVIDFKDRRSWFSNNRFCVLMIIILSHNDSTPLCQCFLGVCVLLKDPSLISFLSHLLHLKIHCSGQLDFKVILCCHPVGALAAMPSVCNTLEFHLLGSVPQQFPLHTQT